MGRRRRDRRGARARAVGAPAPDAPTPRLAERVRAWLFAPQPVARLVALRILVPLAILGFLSSRLVHADHWVGSSGFHVPEVGHGDYRQPFYVPALPNGVAWTLAVLTVVSGLSVAAGALHRLASPVFAVLLIYLALADRLAAFTVSKLGAVLALALALTPAGARVSVDAWLGRRRDPSPEGRPVAVEGGNVRFFQGLLAVLYFSSGVAKVRGDWLDRSDVIYTNLHDSYQTPASYLLASWVPAWGWAGFQWLVLALELGAPIWLTLGPTRLPAVVLLLGMHAIIGLGFGPVIWFALLMASLLVACFAPARWLERALRLDVRLPG